MLYTYNGTQKSSATRMSLTKNITEAHLLRQCAVLNRTSYNCLVMSIKCCLYKSN